MGSYNQPTNKPTRKLTVTAVSGGVAAVAMGLVAIFFPEQYSLVPPGFEAGLATCIGAVAGYLTKEGL